MSYQKQRYANRANSSKTGDYPYQNTSMDASSTFVKPLHDGSSQSPSVYTYSTGTAIPPPPPYLYPQLPSQPRRNRGYLFAIVVLALMLVGLGSLEVVQLAGGKLLTNAPYWSTGSNQSSRSAITLTQNVTVPIKKTPVLTLTPGTIKENVLL